MLVTALTKGKSELQLHENKTGRRKLITNNFANQMSHLSNNMQSSEYAFFCTVNHNITFRIMSPSCRFPSLLARPVLVISLMKSWLPRRRPYSGKDGQKYWCKSSKIFMHSFKITSLSMMLPLFTAKDKY